MRVMKTREGVEIKTSENEQPQGEIEMFTIAFQFGSMRVCGGKDSEESVRITVHTTWLRLSEIRHLCVKCIHMYRFDNGSQTT